MASGMVLARLATCQSRQRLIRNAKINKSSRRTEREPPMTDSLRALLSGAIDYAGLFPPAQLPLTQAYYNHVEYLWSPESWLLGRFVCPAARLPELAALGPLPAGFRVTVLARGRTDLMEDVNALVAFRGD